MNNIRENIYLESMLHGIDMFVNHHSSCDNLQIPMGNFYRDDSHDYDGIINEAYLLASATRTENSGNESNQQLVPITATISNHQNAGDWHQPLSVLSLDRSYFPREGRIENKISLENLWQAFIKETGKIQASTERAYAETLLNLLYKYGSCMPSSVAGLQDVSIYDNIKVASALAVCLYDVSQSEKAPENPFLLIGADLSGIQPYIYTIVSKYAGINLKGRSFYIRILTDAVVRYMLKELHLFQANIIYNAGGGFYLIAPNTQEVKDSLETAIGKIEEKMFAAHGTSLFLAIDSMELSRKTLLRKSEKRLGTVWGELFDKKELKKNARYKDLLSKNYDKLFEPQQKGGDEEVDRITGEYFANGEEQQREGDLFPLRKVTKDQIELGKALQQFEMIVVSECELPSLKEKVNVQPIDLGVYYYFIQEQDWKNARESLKSSSDKIEVVTFNGKSNECNFYGLEDGIGNTCKLDFYGGNGITETFRNEFDTLCKVKSEDSFKRLGVLRMDVDNLGHIFQEGISPQKLNLSRMAALSRSFDYFFSGYINTIWEKVEKEYSLIIYSGGDDLFIIGDWDVTIRMAKSIHDEFREFTCDNPAFSISGGIAVVGDKFPVIKAAQLSADGEKAAKGHVCYEQSKNSISLLGMALNFKKEYPQVETLKEEIVSLCKSDDLPKSFISKVLQHYENANIKGNQIGNIKTYWMMTYDLSRMSQRLRVDKARELIDRCKTEVCGGKPQLNGMPIRSDYHPLELWALASRWAELEIRTNE